VLRRLRRMGEEIGDDALPRFEALLVQAESELGALRPAAPTAAESETGPEPEAARAQ